MKIKILFFFLMLFSASVFAGKPAKIVILHTNDTHSQVEPIESSDMGGYARRMGMKKSARKKRMCCYLMPVIFCRERLTLIFTAAGWKPKRSK